MTTFTPINEVQDAKSLRKARAAFYTPMELVKQIVSAARAWPSARALEPSAGDGRFIHAMQQAGISDISACETDEVMHGRCEELGARMVGRDFLAYQPDGPYDLILMNPPFRGNDAQKHIEHAWSMLADGGQLWSIGPHSLREKIWSCTMDLPGCTYAVYESIDSGSFKDFGTGVKTILITMERGGDAPCEGFSNHSTCNAALTLTTDADLMAKPKSRDADELQRVLSEHLGENNCSCYGVDWHELSRHITAFYLSSKGGGLRARNVPRLDLLKDGEIPF